MLAAMSLRLRLNLIISALFVCLLAASSALVIHNARRAVHEEVRSAAHLTMHLLEVAFATAAAEDSGNPAPALIQRLAAFQRTRHMSIAIRGVAGLDAAASEPRPAARAEAPAWFVRLVEPPPLVLREAVAAQGMPAGEILVRADPADEITEVWIEVRGLLVLLVLFAVLANALVALTIGRGLRPIEAILKGLDAIASGDYAARLAPTRSSELGRIVDKVNRIAVVLERSRSQNRRLAQRSLAIQEDERRRLAHELHDEMGQSISAIKAVAVSISQRCAQDAPQVADSARTISEVSSHVYDTVRGMMHRLRPAILDELGLVTAVEQLVDDWNTHHTDTFCALRVSAVPARPHEAVAITAYRVVQEALTNVARHARAQRVEIELTGTADGRALELTIADDGVGFDPSRITRGLGLLGMQERVEAVNGEFSLQGRPSGGARLWMRIPLHGQASEDESC